jgi:hypothetical protein
MPTHSAFTLQQTYSIQLHLIISTEEQRQANQLTNELTLQTIVIYKSVSVPRKSFSRFGTIALFVADTFAHLF